MSKDKPQYGLREKAYYSREKVEERMLGKIVKIRIGNSYASGVLVRYVSGDFAVLQPYIDIIGDDIVISNEESMVELPGIVSRTSCKTLEEFVKKHVRPALDDIKKQQKQAGKK